MMSLPLKWQPSLFVPVRAALVEALHDVRARVTHSSLRLMPDGRMAEGDRERIRWLLHGALLDAATPFGGYTTALVTINDPNIALGKAIVVGCKVTIDGYMIQL